MATCPSCNTPVPERSRFCGACGSVMPASAAPDDPTVVPQEGQNAIPTMVQRPASRLSGVADDSLFTPGSIIGGRYRIIACLGKGGMGEVYRADDLTLGQAVALKFLPETLGMSPRWMERFRNEVRTARQVAHPNVCRVHDLGETPGPRGAGSLTFLTMEYIDGEDLASLLRRIGRLPRDKALQVAQQLCSGVAAAHHAGVLHRDLKPANIMIDGRGNAKITDFGIAGLAGQIEGADVRSGTPAYMSPEQLAGREVTVRSDVYSLGLVLYEVFTGKQAFKTNTMTSATASRAATPLTRPSTIALDMDPVIERVILRCLSDDPSQRPPSALAIAAALPGGDPLRAALEAGETPSPELVAAAGSVELVRLRVAVPLALIGVLAIVGSLIVSRWTSLFPNVPLPRSPEVLADRAREVVAAMAPELTSKDAADSLAIDFGDFVDVAKSADPAALKRLKETGRPAVVRFWYRASPKNLVPLNPQRRVTQTDPPSDLAGMVSVELDSQGRLIAFQGTPPWPKPGAAPAASDQPTGETQPAIALGSSKVPNATPDGTPKVAKATFDWGRAFTLAGLDMGALKPVDAARLPEHFSDERFAWEGTDPGAPHLPLHVEAASYQGRPTHFRVMKQSDLVETPAPTHTEPGWYLQQFLQALFIVVILTAAWLARRNYLTGSGDRSGAARLSVAFFLLGLVLWALGTHFVNDISQQWRSILLGVSRALLLGAIAWVSYMALEPFVRRRFPELIVSWTRLVAGRVRDPLVGRDALIGFAAGALFVFCVRILPLAHEAVMSSNLPPQEFDVDMLSGVLGASRSITNMAIQSTISAILIFFIFGVCKLLGKYYIGEVLFGLVASYASVRDPAGCSASIAIGFAVLTGVILTIGLRRIGLFSYVVTLFVANVLLLAPPVTNLDSWTARGPAVALLALAGVLAWAFTSATGLGVGGVGKRRLPLA